MGCCRDAEVCPVLAIPVHMKTKDAVRRSRMYQKYWCCSGSESQGHQEPWPCLMIMSVWEGTDGSCESPSVFTVVVNGVLPLWGSRTAEERQDPPVKVGQEYLCQQDDQPGEERFKQGMMAKGEYNKQLSVVAMNGMASRVI